MFFCDDPTHKTHLDCYMRFSNLNYARDDKHVELTDDIGLSPVYNTCELVLYKIKMIKLRRNYSEFDWEWFKSFTEEHIDFILQNFNLRWLLSIVDTYADCGNETERCLAMLVDSFFTFEKLRYTEMCIYDFNEKKEKNTYRSFFKNSLNSVILDQGDDTINNYFSRILRLLRKNTVLEKIFKKYMEYALSENSHFSVLQQHYGYITYVYRNYLEKGYDENENNICNRP